MAEHNSGAEHSYFFDRIAQKAYNHAYCYVYASEVTLSVKWPNRLKCGLENVNMTKIFQDGRHEDRKMQLFVVYIDWVV